MTLYTNTSPFNPTPALTSNPNPNQTSHSTSHPNLTLYLTLYLQARLLSPSRAIYPWWRP